MEMLEEERHYAVFVLAGYFISEYVCIHLLRDGNKRTYNLMVLHFLRPICLYLLLLYLARLGLGMHSKSDFVTALFGESEESGWDSSAVDIEVLLAVATFTFARRFRHGLSKTKLTSSSSTSSPTT